MIRIDIPLMPALFAFTLVTEDSIFAPRGGVARRWHAGTTLARRAPEHASDRDSEHHIQVRVRPLAYHRLGVRIGH